MSEIVERCARAIAVSLEVDPESWRDHVDEARAVIEAMREPTNNMLLRANRLPACDALHFGDIDRIWRAMVDEAAK